MNNPYFSLIQSVWQYGKNYRSSIVISYLALAIAQLFSSLAPYVFGRTLDVLQNFEPDSWNLLVYWACANIGCQMLFWLFHAPARVLERTVALKIKQEFLLSLYQKLTFLPLKWHQNHHSGNILTSVHRATSGLYKFAEHQFIYTQTIIQFLVSIAFLLWISPWVGIASILSALSIIGIILLFDRILIPLYKQENKIENGIGAVLYDYLSNMTTILTLRLESLTHANLATKLQTLWPPFNKEIRVNEAKWALAMNAFHVSQNVILFCYIGHTLATKNSLMIGTLMMIVRYQVELKNVFFHFSQQYSELVQKNTDVQGIQPLITDVTNLAQHKTLLVPPTDWQTITIAGLAFNHTQGKEYRSIFNDLSFSIKRGEKIALIGLSGGGKSTLLNLLRGLYTPTAGTITIDGTKFDSFEILQSITALIPQDPELFENTIEFNITLDLPASPETLNSICTLAGFSSVLSTLPQGLATDIREKGLNLSVGQKQRLALARGLFAARYSSILLMDEPTSSVDLPTEKEILTNVITAFPDTSIIISLHRLHLLPHFDSILMLQDGKLIARGPTTELLNRPGPVQDLWKKYQ